MNLISASVLLSILAMVRFGAFGLPGIDQCQVDQIKGDIIASINEDKHQGSFDRIAGFVRVAFHDCIGNCDGCLDLNHPENAGLDVYVTPLETIYAKYKGILSRADFWQLTGITAIERSASKSCRKCIRPNLVFKTGRKDCPTSPNRVGPSRNFPVGGGHADFNSVMSFLENAFGLPRAEPWLGVALMGAHSLGEAHRAASGWSGPWTPNPDGLTNEYFQLLTRPDWAQNDINDDPAKEPIFQWALGRGHRGQSHGKGKGKGSVMMLNADMVLARKITPDTTGKASCPISSRCPEQLETNKWIKKYASDSALWEKNFAIAYMRMITTGYTAADLHDIAPCP